MKKIRDCIISCFLFVQLLLLPYHSDACNKLKVRQAHEWAFGVSYPYWFSLAQAQIESNCRWLTSLDGWGSVGYFQITPYFWDRELKQVGFYNWQLKDSMDYYYSHAYILKKLHNQNPCGRLYITYQCYNRSCNKVVRENACCDWQSGYETCLKYGKNVCVWRKNGKCIQYRNECEINYFYSSKIYREGIKMQEWVTKDWRFY